MGTKTRGEPRSETTASESTFNRISRSRASQRALLIAQIVLFAIIVAQFTMMYKSYVAASALALAGSAQAAAVSSASSSSSSSVPDYYKTDPAYFSGQSNFFRRMCRC
jgi:uncharacterized protein (UPF0333 family)